jgi:hypothetical protein
MTMLVLQGCGIGVNVAIAIAIAIAITAGVGGDRETEESIARAQDFVVRNLSLVMLFV